MEWTHDLSVGIGEIDVQHRKIIRKINEISEAAKANAPKEAVEEEIKYLEVYAENHFATEEGYMVRFIYPELAEHKKIHAQFKADVAQLRERFNAGKIDATEVYRISEQTVNWFVNHMKTVDTRMAAFLRGKLK